MAEAANGLWMSQIARNLTDAEQGILTGVCHECEWKLAELYRRWEQASRSRLQELTSNRPELLRSKGAVVNVRGKGVRRGRQVSVEKMSESEPTDDASSRIQGTVKTGAAQ